MKKSLVLAMAMALGVTASAYAANPFSDVPAGHWAYDSVAKLAAAGVVDGYADGAFDGEKLMTRYEMAQIVAKAMAKGADCDKLAAEFADELDTLGVRVAKLEKGADAVKITGELRYRMYNYDVNGKDSEDHKLRTRIWLKGQVNEDWVYTGMFENIQELKDDDGEDGNLDLQRAYLNGKLGGLAVQAGRYGYADPYGGIIYDHRMDGVQVSYGKEVKLTVGAGKASGGNGTAVKDPYFEAKDVAYANLAAKLGVVDASAAYYKFEDVKATSYYKLNENDVEIFVLGAAMPIAKDVKLAGYYLINESDMDNADDGFVVGLNWKKASAAKVGSWGVWAKWYDQPVGTYVDPTWEAKEIEGGWEGYGIGVDYTVAKNMVASVKYYDLEAQEGSNDAETLYAQLNVTF
ncbi:MAG: S-layer homology domain-containing protein [Phascolarctobacterium sp.]|nr:S-layer homology domain-containing protein [Phascolarctobacterium sp.]